MIIRKISIGTDYKSSAMHYHIRMEKDSSIKIWIEKEGEVVLWKEFNPNMPVSIEYNINF